ISREAIEAVTAAVYGTSTQVYANVPFAINTGQVSEGKYRLYVIGHSGLISSGEDLTILPHNLEYMENTSSLVSYNGRWDSFSNPLYSGGTMMLGREKGAYVDIPFYGVSAQLIADRHTSRGK